MSLSFVRELEPAKVPGGNYSMWWPTAGDETFTTSPVVSVIRATYGTLDGIHSYVFADLVNVLDGDSGSKRIALPDPLATFHAIDRSGLPLVLSASAAKGIRLHLHERSSHDQRLAAWKDFAAYAAKWLELVRRVGAPPDPASDAPPRGWWAQIERLGAELEASKDPAKGIGTVLIG